MKKVLFVLAAVTISAFVLSSCIRTKSCECKDYENGVVVREYTEQLTKVMGAGTSKCKDLNITTQDSKTECK